MIVAVGLAVMVLSAQDDLDTVRQAAEQGDAKAQFSLGFMYANGQGVPKDDAEAMKWYRLAADQGYAAACSLTAGEPGAGSRLWSAWKLLISLQKRDSASLIAGR